MKKGSKNMLKKLLVLFSCAVALAGCATGSIPPVKEIATTEKEISVAREGNASRYAPLELRRAEDKLKEAKSAFANEEYDKARRLAEEASIDAKLADAISSSEKEKKLLRETKDNINILQNEIERLQKTK